MRLLLISLPNDLLVLILQYLDGTDIVRLVCTGNSAILTRLRRLQAFQLTIPKHVGPIDWVKSIALISQFDPLISLSLIAGNAHQPPLRALKSTLLPTTLRDLELRFRGAVTAFATHPAMFSHLQSLESLNIEQRSSLSSKHVCIGLLSLPKSLTRLRVWATAHDPLKAEFSIPEDMEYPEPRFWIHSTHVEALTAIRKVTDFKSNVRVKRVFDVDSYGSQDIVNELNNRIANEKGFENASERVTAHNMLESANSPFFGSFGLLAHFNLTHLYLMLAEATRAVDCTLLPPSLVELSIFVEPRLYRGYSLATNVAYINYMNFKFLKVLRMGQFEDNTWSWLLNLSGSLRRLYCHLVPPSKEHLPAILETLECRNDDHLEKEIFQLIPALLVEFEIMEFLNANYTPAPTPIPSELVHCFTSVQNTRISHARTAPVPPPFPFVDYEVKKNSMFWPPGAKRVIAHRLVPYYSSEAMYQPYCDFLTLEASVATEERRSKSKNSETPNDSFQLHDLEISSSTSSSSTIDKQHSSVSSPYILSGGHEMSNKIFENFHFRPSTLTSLQVNSEFSANHLCMIPCTLRELRVSAPADDIWTSLCFRANTRFPELSIVSIRNSQFPIDLPSCPPTVHTLEIDKLEPFSINCKDLVTLRHLRVFDTPISWSDLEYLPPCLESLEIEIIKKFDFTIPDTKPLFPVSLRHLQFTISDIASNNPFDSLQKFGCPFRTQSFTLSGFLEDESRFYKHILKGLDSLTSLSIPSVDSPILLSSYQSKDVRVGLKYGRLRLWLRSWLSLRIPFYGLFSDPQPVFWCTLTRQRIQSNLSSCKSLTNIVWTPKAHLLVENYLLYQYYLESRGILHEFDCETRKKFSLMFFHAVAAIPMVAAGLLVTGIKAGYRFIFASKEIPQKTIESVAHRLDLPWIRIWFCISAVSTIALAWKENFGGGTQEKRSLWTNARNVALHLVNSKDRLAPILVGAGLVYLLIPILFPSKTTFWIVEASLLAVSSLLGSRR